MSKKLSEMSLEELWRLFPIFLTEHKSIWEQWYQEELENLQAALSGKFEINHVGSTAICGISAKPIERRLATVKKHIEQVTFI